MSASPNPTSTAVPRPGPVHPISPLAALLSYLIPGLGQVYQGRIGKGVLFFACIYTLFFYGNALGSGSVEIQEARGPVLYRVSGAVYLPDVYVPRMAGMAQVHGAGQDLPEGPGAAPQPTRPQRNPFSLDRLGTNLYNRPQFLGQFWVGVAAWPAIWQYYKYGNDQTTPDPNLGFFMREPSERAINAVGTTGSKTMDLGWVFTVIAGVLNIMVIYDALAGPAVPRAQLNPVAHKETTEDPAQKPAEEPILPVTPATAESFTPETPTAERDTR